MVMAFHFEYPLHLSIFLLQAFTTPDGEGELIPHWEARVVNNFLSPQSLSGTNIRCMYSVPCKFTCLVAGDGGNSSEPQVAIVKPAQLCTICWISFF